MQVKTNAVIYSAESFHSSKTNKDYHRCGLIIEGTATTFFLDDKPWNELVKEPFFNAVCVSHTPTNVEIDLEIHFNEKGASTYLRGVKGIKAK